MLKTVEIKQNTNKWLEMRKNFIGASDVPIILGESPYMTPFELWQVKMGISQGAIETPAMRKGKELEGHALSLYNQKQGETFTPQVILHPTIKYLMASLDGLNEDHTRAVEIKNPSLTDFIEVREGRVPIKWRGQLQAQIMVTGFDSIDLMPFREKDGSVILTVNRDDEYQSRIKEACEKFYDCMINFTPPEMTERDVINMEENSEWVHTSKQYADSCDELKLVKEENERLRKKLIELSGDRSAEGNGVRVTRCIVKGRISYNEIPELKGMDLDVYRSKSSIQYRITLN